MKLFITGISTDVGKTIASAILTEALQADYWKPVQSGTNDGRDSETIKSLISNSKTVIHSETYLLKEPLSPHFAAKLENVKVDLDKIELPETTNHLIIEGAGGLLVPINQNNYVIDIAKKFDCEVVLVISNYLGCINHSLLSIDYLIRNHFKIHSLVFNGEFEQEIMDSIVHYSSNSRIVRIPTIKNLSKTGIVDVAARVKQQMVL